MLNWSNPILKITFGVGGLGISGILFALSDQAIIPFWLLFCIAFMPFMIFVFVKPDELFPNQIVSYFHMTGVLWYILCVTASVYIYYFKINIPAKDFVLYSILMSVGLIPCIVFFRKYFSGGYRKKGE